MWCFVEVKPSEQGTERPPLSSVKGRTEQRSKSACPLLLHRASLDEFYIGTVKCTADYTNIYSQNLEISEGRMFIVGQIHSYHLEVCRETMLYNYNAQMEETSTVIIFIQII
jgi:hypothetical protein